MAISKWILGKLSRITSSGRFVPEIDGLRFVAIMSVVIFHTYGSYFSDNYAEWEGGWHILAKVWHQGWFGVQLFFVISGFILSMPMAEQRLAGGRPASIKKYFLRRVTRLEPPYLINLAVLFTLAVLLHAGADKFARFTELLPHYIASCFYVHNIAYHPDGSWINPAAWSLEVEVQFYIIAPLLGLVYLIRPAILRRGLLLAAIAIGSMSNIIPDVNMSVIGQIAYFMVGFLLSEIYVTMWKGQTRKTWLWDVLGIAAWCSLPLVISGAKHVLPLAGKTVFGWSFTVEDLEQVRQSGWNSIQAIPLLMIERDFLAPWVILLAYIGVFRGWLLNRIFNFRWIVVIGGMCYTIYLYHMTVLEFVHPWVEKITRPFQQDNFNLPIALVQEFCLVGSVLLCSAVLFVFLEKPFMRKDWPSRWWAWITKTAVQPAKPAKPAEPAN